jgi:hypothetical protein
MSGLLVERVPGDDRFQRPEPIMKSGAYYLALGIGLLSETSFASQQRPSPTLVAQVTGTVPPSGVLITPPPAPVAVPPSGVLATTEHGHVPTLPFKTAQKMQTTKKAIPAGTRRHDVHWRSATRRKTTTPTGDQSVAATPLVVKTSPEQSRPDGIGYESFLPQFGKGKE